MRTIILLSVVAFAFATPINEQSVKGTVNPANPDISKLPLKKDDQKVDPVKIESVHSAGGVQAHPLHKRDTPPRAEQPLANTQQANGAKTPAAPATSQNGQQPIYNKPAANSNAQKSQQPSNLNNQKPANSNVQRNQPLNNQQKTQPAVNNQQKTQPAANPQAAKPSTQNGQAAPVITSQSARVRREAPKAVDTKAAPQVPSNQQKTPAADPVNSQKSPAQPAQAPKSRDTVKTQQPASNIQKPAATPVNTQQKSPQPPRKTREAVDNKPVDAKASPQVASNSQKKVAAPAAPVTNQKPAQGSRVNRESPKPADQKPAQPLNAQKAQPAAAAPISKTPAAAPVKSRIAREAPKPSEQTKAAPAGDSTHLKSDSHPAVVAKTSETLQKKGINSQQTVTYDHQSPSFVHPIPVDQILKKPAVPATSVNTSGAQVVGGTKTDSARIEPALPTSDSSKPVVSADQKAPVKA